MKLINGEPMKPNTVTLFCTLLIVAALIWNVQANRYRFSENGYIFDAVSLSFYDPQANLWISLIKE